MNKSCETCGACLCPEDRPSPIFVIFSFIVNIIPLIIAITGLVGDDKDLPCTSKCRMWLGVAIGACAVNLLFALYIYVRFMNDLRAGSSAGESAGKLFLYDPGVYIYIWFLIFLIVWMIMGWTWMGDEKVCATVKSTVSTVSTFFAIYLGLGGCVIFMTLATECCKGKPSGRQQQTHQVAPTMFAAPQGGHNQQYAPPQAQPYAQQPPQYYGGGGAPTGQQPQWGAPPATNPYAAMPPPQQQQAPVQQGGFLSGLVRGVIRKVI